MISSTTMTTCGVTNNLPMATAATATAAVARPIIYIHMHITILQMDLLLKEVFIPMVSF
jgi:hypothetical protein